MNISIIGTGYVGLVTGAGFAETGNQVLCMDIIPEKVENLRKGIIPIFEPGLEELVKFNVQEGRLKFTLDLKEAVDHAEVIFLALPTPPGADGAADLSMVLETAKGIAQLVTEPKVVVNKSTVPVGTADRVRAIFESNTDIPIAVVSNPEFLKEGAAVQDFMKPDRIVVGSRDPGAIMIMKELYEPFVRTGNPIYIMDEKSSELTKYAANSLLATKISFMNEIANLCDLVGADVEHVRIGVGSDGRIGPQFLFPGVGYGGSCFPKDIKALVKTAEEMGHDFAILKAVEDANNRQKTQLLRKILLHYNGDITGKTFAVWGLAFKPRTDDIREAPAIEIITGLIARGARVHASDPAAIAPMKNVLPESESLKYFRKNTDALEGADALVVVTEWNEFRNPNFELIATKVRDKVIFDGRNIYDPERMREFGFTYFGIGRR
ncbi:MAG: UDP-glucose/GDP-mannose dehydrogenase family protein [Bacteroidota bacterium]|nr:UDP-glucose/GDP-mannose dehydrogenase family protein [Bacteroidota bacterium]MDP4231982.1 UDP-glucose/GDP-mannose dehydrogenase family protein [Bacteroidota bacterium]MDP4241311.1 UDP-glucose/GDP-mannose dehydrogenase family protein [Bacteroidota bacterium]